MLNIKLRVLGILIPAYLLLCGCGAPFKDEVLLDKAATALQLPHDNLRLIKREDSADIVEYLVKTNVGRLYLCYLDCIFWGDSQAVCRQIGQKM